MTQKNPQTIIDQLSSHEAHSILQTLVKSDPQLGQRIAQLALERISEVDAEEVKAIVFSELEALEVEEVWDKAGSTRYGYVETGEVADEMIQRVLEPYLEELTRYQILGLSQEATAVCVGILKGLYQFETESTNEFKDWAVELPFDHAIATLEQWQTNAVTKDDIREMQSIINQLHAFDIAPNACSLIISTSG